MILTLTTRQYEQDVRRVEERNRQFFGVKTYKHENKFFVIEYEDGNIEAVNGNGVIKYSLVKE